ncbi:uncharacterized protein C12orf42 homolog isoform X2 [Zalophus californianus]|uniref:Uncharacterized protein C12orf42 homolog isoform X2 n=1 Tax=Zalophus californianus TaxID=9704 RepID=A0A6J2D4M3_ZALCA|nr:uncharacterized protein C12orf42 homolog isoform X2 [Zalophus californianus]
MQIPLRINNRTKTPKWYVANGSQPSPPHEIPALPCSRFTDHMKNFSESLKLRSLCFLHFPGKIQTPVACKSLLYVHPHTVPRPPVVSAASEEESHGEASSSQTPSNQFDETLLIFTVRREIKRARGAPREAWSSPILAKHMTKNLIRSHSVTPLHLEAAGTHISRHRRLQNRPSCDARGYSAPLGPAARHSTAIGLCRKSQTPLASSEVPRSSSEPELEDRKAAPGGAQADPHRQSRPRGAPLSPAGGGAVAMAPEMLPKHPHPPGKREPRVDASLHGNLAGASLPLLAGAPTHLPSKKLIKVCSSPPARPPQRFHTVCSQAPPRPGVNAHLH